MAGITTAVGAAGFGFNNMRQQSEIAFTTMLGDGAKARKFLDDLQNFAARTPFEFPDLVVASQRLLAMGFASEQVLPTISAIGDAAAGLSTGSEGISRMTTALGQMLAKGKVSGEEMRQFAEAGVPAWRFLAERIGVDIPTAMKMVEKGAVTGAVGVAAITEGMQRQFGGLMEQQARTAGGLVSTLKDTFGIISGAIMKPFFDLASKGMQGLADLVTSPAFAEGAAAFAAGLQKALDIVGELLGVLTGKAPDAGAALTAALGPDAAKVIMQALAGIREVAQDVFAEVGKAIDFVREHWDIFAPAFAAMATYVIIPALVAWAKASAIAAAGTIAALLPVLVPIAAVGAAVAALAFLWQNNVFDIQGKTQALVGFLQGAFNTIVSAVQFLWDRAQAIWAQFTENPPKMIGTMIGFIIGFFATLPGRIGGILAEALGNLLGFIGESIDGFGKWASENEAVIGSFLGSLPQKFWDGAIAAVQGFLNGLGSMKTAVWNTVKSFFEGIVNGVKSALGMSSPSRVFEGIGRNMLAGLEQGLKDDIGLGALEDITAVGRREFVVDIRSSDGSVNAMSLETMRAVARDVFGGVLGEAKREVRGGVA